MNRRTFLAAGSATVASSALALNPPRKLRVGVIGHTGRGNYGHGLDTVWQKLPDTEIVAVADAHVNGLANARKRLQVPQGFADYREMLRKVKLDIVAVCRGTPINITTWPSPPSRPVCVGFISRNLCADTRRGRFTDCRLQ